MRPISDENLYAALRAGTSGFLLKVSPPEQLVEAIRVRRVARVIRPHPLGLLIAH